MLSYKFEIEQPMKFSLTEAYYLFDMDINRCGVVFYIWNKSKYLTTKLGVIFT